MSEILAKFPRSTHGTIIIGRLEVLFSFQLPVAFHVEDSETVWVNDKLPNKLSLRHIHSTFPSKSTISLYEEDFLGRLAVAITKPLSHRRGF